MAEWLTPVWILSAGTTLGLLFLLITWCLLYAVSRQSGHFVASSLSEGPLFPIFLLLILLAAVNVITLPFAESPQQIIGCLSRHFSVGTHSLSHQVPAADQTWQETPLDLSLRRNELRHLEFNSTGDLAIRFDPSPDQPNAQLELRGGEPYQWSRSVQSSGFLPAARVERLLITNYGEEAVTLTISTTTDIRHPEARTILVTAVGTVVLFVIFLLHTVLAPKISAIALATSKSEMAQPLFLIATIVGIVFVIFSIWLPYNTFGEDIKMLKDAGLTTILVLAVVVSIWGASNSLSEEIEGRTALTVLSKPIGRRQFVFGKFLGIIWTAAVLFILVGTVFLITVSYKAYHDAYETAQSNTLTWQACHAELVHTAPGLLLAFFETIVLTSISIAISTRLPMIPNFLLSFSFYVLGHLTPLIVQSSWGQFPPIVFMGRLIATVVPMLDYFNIQSAIAGDIVVDPSYLAAALVYCALYSSVAMLLALVLFEDRDLA